MSIELATLALEVSGALRKYAMTQMDPDTASVIETGVARLTRDPKALLNESGRWHLRHGELLAAIERAGGSVSNAELQRLSASITEPYKNLGNFFQHDLLRRVHEQVDLTSNGRTRLDQSRKHLQRFGVII